MSMIAQKDPKLRIREEGLGSLRFRISGRLVSTTEQPAEQAAQSTTAATTHHRGQHA
jgi:hypothetical protein